MFCTNCGKENRNDRKFCVECGKALPDYTKPKENLIMPEEIAKKKEIVKASNKSLKIISVVMILIFLLGASALTVSFITKGVIQLVMIISSLALLLLLIGLWIVRGKINKKLSNLNK